MDLAGVALTVALIPWGAWAVARALGKPAPGGWASGLALVAGVVALRTLGEVSTELGGDAEAGERLRALPGAVSNAALLVGIGAMGTGLLEVLGVVRQGPVARPWPGRIVGLAALVLAGWTVTEGIRLWSGLADLALALDQRSAGGIVRPADRDTLRDLLVRVTTAAVVGATVGWIGTWIALFTGGPRRTEQPPSNAGRRIEAAKPRT